MQTSIKYQGKVIDVTSTATTVILTEKAVKIRDTHTVAIPKQMLWKIIGAMVQADPPRQREKAKQIFAFVRNVSGKTNGKFDTLEGEMTLNQVYDAIINKLTK